MVLVSESADARIAAAVGLVARFVFNACKKIAGIGVEMAFEPELVAGRELAAIAFSIDVLRRHVNGPA